MQQAVKSFAKLVEVVLVILMALMVLVVFFATVGRYTQLFSIPWSEEFARYCMVAIVYLGLMLASLTKQHFVVELVPLIFKNKPAVIKICNIIVTICMDLFAIFMAKYGWLVVSKMLNQGKESPMLHLPLGMVYLLVPVGIVLMAIFYTYRMYLDLTEEKEA
ncbi:MAG: TRAP transporter small permease [Quinella sp. 1Q7]|nr:TRAP transporter small permease [Quinella sp. 1Q7]